MSALAPEKEAQARAACLLLAQRVRCFFTDEEHRRQFEAWYEKRYGKKYIWKEMIV